MPCHRLLEYLSQRLVEGLNCSIFLRIVAGGVVPPDLVLRHEPVHLFGLERLGVVGGDAVWYPEAIYDILL